MNRTELILLVEEAHLHMTRQRMLRYDQGEPLIVRLLRTGRKHGISVVVVDQTPSELPPAVLGNLATRVVFRLTNELCARAVSVSMGMDDGQKDELVELPRRRAIIQSADNPKPFMIRVVEIPERYRPGEEELLERERQSLAGLDHEVPEADAAEVLYGKKEEPEFRVKAIRGDMHKVLARIAERPCETIEERGESLGMERAKEYRARQNLEKLGMIEPGDRVGSKWQLYVLTAKGREWAASLGLKVPEFKSGVGHEFMAARVREALERFFEGMEFFPPGKGLGIAGVQPDLLAGLRGHGVDGGWRMAIQVCSTNKGSYEADRAVALSGIEQIDLVVIVAKNKGSRREVERKLREKADAKGLLWTGDGVRKDQDDHQKHHEDEQAKDASGGDSGGSKGGEGETHFQQRAGCIKITDFETCASPEYDWTWVIE
jgi:hypothetical protein